MCLGAGEGRRRGDNMVIMIVIFGMVHGIKLVSNEDVHRKWLSQIAATVVRKNGMCFPDTPFFNTPGFRPELLL